MILTIITASYNSDKHIMECLESTKILCEEYEGVEHLIFDGGSKDKTLEIVSKFKHVRTVESKGDNGVYDAFNKAIPHAKGKYILFLNSDDKFISKKNKEIISLLSSSENIWITGFINFIDDNGVVLRQDKVREKLSYYRFLISNTIRHPATFVKKEYLLNNKFNLKYKFASDYDFFLNLWNLGGEPVVVPWIVSSFRLWEGSLSSNVLNSMRDEYQVRVDWRKANNFSILYLVIDKIIFYLRILKLKA